MTVFFLFSCLSGMMTPLGVDGDGSCRTADSRSHAHTKRGRNKLAFYDPKLPDLVRRAAYTMLHTAFLHEQALVGAVRTHAQREQQTRTLRPETVVNESPSPAPAIITTQSQARRTGTLPTRNPTNGCVHDAAGPACPKKCPARCNPRSTRTYKCFRKS